MLNRTNLDFGRYDDVASMRPWMIYSKDNSYEQIGNEAIKIPNQTSLSISSMSVDGTIAYLNSSWENPQNGMLEEMEGEFRINADNYLVDIYSYNLLTKEVKNLTEVNRVSYYNTGAYVWSEDPNLLVFPAMIDNKPSLYLMNKDGTNKQPFIDTTPGYTYGFNASPDGTKFAFHSDYKLYIGDTSTGQYNQIQTPCNFNFLPNWSPDSQHLIFYCGENNYSPDIYITDRNGTSVSFLANRNGYSGVNQFIDSYDFHGGSSDYVVLTNDFLIYAANDNDRVELFKIDITTKIKTQLTFSDKLGSSNYYPTLYSNYLLYVSTKTGIRQLNILDLSTLENKQITDMNEGCGTFIPQWRPTF